jgi:HD-like signal output (HDOD) protein
VPGASRLSGGLNVERFSVAGLPHDIGRPVLCLRLPAESHRALERCRATGERLARVEAKLLGLHHGHVDAALLEHWRLSALLQ